MARLRAVEHGRSTVVPTTSGISALVRPDGEVIRSGLFKAAVLQAAVPRRTALTLATRFGAPVQVALASRMLLSLLWRSRHRALPGVNRSPTTEPSVSAARMET